MKHQVWLCSDEHGIEKFDYDTLDEALAGFERVKANARAEVLKDDVDRQVILVLDSFNTFDELGCVPQD